MFDYRGSRETRPATQHTGPWPYYVEAAKKRLGYSPKFGLNGDNTYKYINVFAYSCRHEATHGSDFVTWWGNHWNGSLDTDLLDGLPAPDSMPTPVETVHGYDPMKYISFPPPPGIMNWDDDQRYTLLHEPVWGEHEGDLLDWAYPGAQYP